MIQGFPIRLRIIAATVLIVSPQIVPAAGSAEADGGQTLLRRLGDSHFSVRQAAMDALLKDASLTLEKIDGLYRRATDEEQRQRLLVVARHHMLRLMAIARSGVGRRGVIGINMHPVIVDNSPQSRELAVRVTAVLAGFPGYVHLRAGDLILSLDRVPVADAESLSNIVMQKKPGDLVNVTVLRAGRRVAVRFRLFDYRAMREMYSLPSARQPVSRLLPLFSKKWRQLRRSMEANRPTRPLLEIDTRHIRASAPQPEPGLSDEAASATDRDLRAR
jgi:hypothetical protein